MMVSVTLAGGSHPEEEAHITLTTSRNGKQTMRTKATVEFDPASAFLIDLLRQASPDGDLLRVATRFSTAARPST